jgi:hypothetical protein
MFPKESGLSLAETEKNGSLYLKRQIIGFMLTDGMKQASETTVRD